MPIIACKAVFFDAGNTLFRPHPSVGEIYARVAARYGVSHPPEVLEQRFHERWRQKGGLSSLSGPATPAMERQWWYSLVREVFEDMTEGPIFDRFFEDLYHTFGQAKNWKVFPEVKDTLEKLKGRGFRMGIISNWDSRLLGLCKGMELESYFDFVLISAMLGHSKPNPRIFQDALRLTGCKPQEALHVGDSYDDDYQAALAAGLNAIYLDRKGSCTENIPTIRDLRDLLSCVALAVS